ncbi:MAG: phosphohydrolase [Tenericutes bacterium HGW-Tenericutes-1]|jgi:predicted HD superfamily hydrolase involved in NAD metabolism|nr:MAG: phosphohydrolase [Tenericutes bacterium HGW-Tenericutes-1]
MLNFNQILPIVESKLGLSSRMSHTMQVVETAIKLAHIYHADVEKVKIAALLHDVTKHETDDYHQSLIESYFDIDTCNKWPKPIWHALSAVVFAKKIIKIDDLEILNAIKYHTSGRPEMSLIEKIIFVADYIEPTRKFDNSKIRNLAYNNLDKALATILKSQNDYLESIGEVPVSEEVEALRYYQHLLEE